MRTLFRKTLILLFSFILQVQSFTGAIAYAQEATNSAAPAASPSAQVQTATSTVPVQGEESAPASDLQNPFADYTPFTPSQKSPQQTLSTLLAGSLGSSQSPGSAAIRQLAVIQKLQKRTFKANEAITLMVSNATADEVNVSLTDWKGRTINTFFIDKQTIDTQTTITVNPPTIGFKPGKYTLHITDPDGKTTTQDFTWGVLAMNTNKSVYTPQETAKIAIAVLDEHGNMVCGASVKLTVQNAKLHINDELSTDNGKIKVNPQCLSHDLSLTPDYAADYQLQGVGQYTVTVTATTKNGTYTIDDGVTVVTAVPFDVERTTVTRIYPPNKYPVTFHITANRDFTGTVTDYAPANFDIEPYATGSGTSNVTAAQTYDSASLQVPAVDTQTAFGVPSVSLAKPFSGTYPLEQGFGAKMTDPQEAPYYTQFGLAGHDGLDFGLPSGTPVLAADDGTVSLAGDGAYGTTVVIDHAWGRSYYGHLSELKVRVGDKVTKGFEIALSGNSGHTTGPHLHFGIKPKNLNMQNGYYGKVDPSPYLSSLDTGSASGEAVLGISTATVGDTAMKVIHWHVSVKKGDTIDLAYAFKAPDISPAFYTLGPLTFEQNQQTVFQEQRQWQIAADTVTVQIRQEINILSQAPSGFATSGSNTPGELVQLDTTQYSGTVTYYFEIVVKASASTNTGTVSLQRHPAGSKDATISNITSTSFTRMRSAAFTPPSGQTLYEVALVGDGVRTQTIISARILVFQNAGTITSTETQIGVVDNETNTNTTAAQESNPEYWHYDSNNWSPAPTFYAEVVWCTSTTQTATITLQEDNGSFASWADKATIVNAQSTSGCNNGDTRTRVSFTPTSGRNYTISAKESASNGGKSYQLADGKIVADQSNSVAVTKLEPQYFLLNNNSTTTGDNHTQTLWDSTEWSGVTNTYYHAQDAVGSTANAKLVDINNADALITNSSLTGANQQISSALTMPASGHEIDTNIITAGTSVEASRILTDVVTNANFFQTHYRWRNDDGSETGATWMQAQDTAQTNQLAQTNFRLRIEVANKGGVSATKNFQLEYAVTGTCSSGTYYAIPVNATVEPFSMSDSKNFSNGAATTAQLTATGTFVAGKMVANPSNSVSIAVGAVSYTEIEYMIYVTRNALLGQQYCFRLTDAGAALDTYS